MKFRPSVAFLLMGWLGSPGVLAAAAQDPGQARDEARGSVSLALHGGSEPQSREDVKPRRGPASGERAAVHTRD